MSNYNRWLLQKANTVIRRLLGEQVEFALIFMSNRPASVTLVKISDIHSCWPRREPFPQNITGKVDEGGEASLKTMPPLSMKTRHSSVDWVPVLVKFNVIASVYILFSHVTVIELGCI